MWNRCVALHLNVLTTPTKGVSKPSNNLTPYTQQRLQMSMAPQSRTPINVRTSPQLRTNNNNPPLFGTTSPNVQQTHSTLPSPAIQQMQLQRRWQTTPYPIINESQKNLFEKVVDYLIGEGPSSRYGMICKECHGHNGK